jgi:sulfate adenylyltransferase
VTPYGGSLVDLLVREEELPELLERAARLPSVQISDRSVCDLELLASGGFSPLTGFLGREDHASVLERMRLADGTLWPIPITLPVPAEAERHLGATIALRSPRNDLLALMQVREAFRWDLRAEAMALTGQLDTRHPLVSEMHGWDPVCLAGPLQVLTPRQVRQRLLGLGRPRVVGFQTRNPLHRSHEELTRRAMERADATLLLHPVVGMTKPGDVDHFTRVRSYRALVAAHYPADRTLLALLPLAMRMAGPREALWHALIRRNHGASHFVVGRDHAGPGADSSGKPFYGPYAAQELARAHQAELGVEVLTFQEMVYLPDEDRYEEADRLPAGARTLSISGTQVREEYLARGRALPAWFTRPETAQILAEAAPPRHRQGFCVWFTGLSGAGKSVTAESLTTLLLERGRQVTLLDGDVVRTHLSKGLGFSREDRDTNIRRIGFVAAEIARHGGAVICAAVSPYRSTRDECRERVGSERFLEVFVDTPIAVCEPRDVKGLYAKARRGELPGFTGVDDPYEPPAAPELRLSTTDATPRDNARRIVEELARRGFLAG